MVGGKEGKQRWEEEEKRRRLDVGRPHLSTDSV